MVLKIQILLRRSGSVRVLKNRIAVLFTGTLIITACDGVFPPGVGDPRVWIGETQVILNAGEEGQLTARYQQDRRSSLEEVTGGTWRSDDITVISITDAGQVKALEPGTAHVTIRYKGAKDVATVHVHDGLIEPHTKWAAVAVGPETNCALTIEWKAYCWGGDYYGATGDGRLRRWTDAHAPVAVEGDHDFVEISVGRFHACARTATGEAWCWGDSNVLGADGSPSDHVLKPRRVQTSVRFAQLRSGENHICGLNDDGMAYCWGYSARGEIGNGSFGIVSFFNPQLVDTDARFAEILPGHFSTCAVGLDGRAYCWGSGSFGGLGTGSQLDRSVPQPVQTDQRFHDISGTGVRCGETSDAFYCWGSDRWKALGGDSDFVLVPTAIGSEKQQFDEIIVGSVTVCGLRSGEAFCWGYDRFGNLGAGELAEDRCALDLIPCTAIPRPVTGGLRFTQLSMSMTSSCGVTDRQALYCWGSNDSGQLGGGSLLEYSAVPVRVADPQ